jgi:hypothetical protein
MSIPAFLLFVAWLSTMISADEDQRRATARRRSL